jgi:hypothetical protein
MLSRMKIAAIAMALLTGASLPAQDQAPKAGKESRTAYLRRIFEKDRASFGDACRAVLSVMKNEHTDADFATVFGDLNGRGVVSSAWALQESSLLTKGTLAYMVCQALEIKGGVTLRLFGINRRYALRECLFRRLIASGTVDEYVTGRELIDVVTNATVHREQGHTDSQFK